MQPIEGRQRPFAPARWIALPGPHGRPAGGARGRAHADAAQGGQQRVDGGGARGHVSAAGDRRRTGGSSTRAARQRRELERRHTARPEGWPFYRMGRTAVPFPPSNTLAVMPAEGVEPTRSFGAMDVALKRLSSELREEGAHGGGSGTRPRVAGPALRLLRPTRADASLAKLQSPRPWPKTAAASAAGCSTPTTTTSRPSPTSPATAEPTCW